MAKLKARQLVTSKVEAAIAPFEQEWRASDIITNTLKQLHAAATAHEWELTDDRKHWVCVTCGRRWKESATRRTHNADCHYAALLAFLETTEKDRNAT